MIPLFLFYGAFMFDLFFSYVYQFLHRYLGVRRPLSAREKTLAWMFSLYDFNYALSNIFMTVFLFKSTEDYRIPSYFYMTQFATIVPAFWIGGHLSKRFGNLLSYQLGFVFSALLFATTLVLRGDSPRHPCLLGVFAGLGIGFYFLGEHSLTLDVTTEKTRDYFLSLTTFFTSVLCILAPQISGWLIRFFGAGKGSLMGYYLVFAIALAIYLLLIYKSLEFKAEPTGKGFYFWRVLTFKNNENWNRLMGVQFLLGLRGGLFWFLGGLLVYEVSKNEAVVGGYGTFVNLLGLLTSYALSIWAKAENRWNGLWISSCLVSLASVGLFFKIGYLSLAVYAVLAATGSTWLQVVYGAFSFTVLEKAREAKARKIEYLAAREVPLALGRILGVLLFLQGQSYFGNIGFRTAILVLGAAYMGLFLFLPKNKVGEIHATRLKKA
jgi:YQGE family putative transporter